MAFRNVIIENPCKCTYQGGYLVVRSEDDAVKVHLSEISSITLATTHAFMSTYLLSELAKEKISLVICDEKRNPIGQYLPLYGAHNVSKRIPEQLEWSEPIKKRVWQHIVCDKILHQARVLELHGHEAVSEQLKTLVSEVRSGDTTNREAHAARLYFQTLFGNNFSRDDPTAINSGLDYGYAILLSAVNREVVSRGYITPLGICHRNEYNHFNLGCDFMEPFRPLVDITVVENIEDEFSKNERRVLVDMLNKTISYRGGVYKVSSVISLYVNDCLNALCKRLPVSQIEGFDVV